jgi:hypothetical protein
VSRSRVSGDVLIEKVVLRCRAGQAMAGLGVDNVSVFFLAEGEQPAGEVMARLTSFIRAGKQA